MDDKLSGVTKLIFNNYFSLLGIIKGKFYKVLEIKNITVLLLNHFIKWNTIYFVDEYEEAVKIIFNCYEMDNDGIVNKDGVEKEDKNS